MISEALVLAELCGIFAFGEKKSNLKKLIILEYCPSV